MAEQVHFHGFQIQHFPVCQAGSFRIVIVMEFKGFEFVGCYAFFDVFVSFTIVCVDDDRVAVSFCNRVYSSFNGFLCLVLFCLPAVREFLVPVCRPVIGMAI